MTYFQQSAKISSRQNFRPYGIMHTYVYTDIPFYVYNVLEVISEYIYCICKYISKKEPRVLVICVCILYNSTLLLFLGCGSRHVVIQSPRMHLISDSCPLMVNMHHTGNGSFFRSVRLHKCEYKQGGFLQARLQLIPKPLVYRVSGCDAHGNHFERAILTPFFTPRIAMVTLTRDPSDDVARTNTSSIVSFTVQSMEHEPVTVSFKVGLRLAKDSDMIM